MSRAVFDAHIAAVIERDRAQCAAHGWQFRERAGVHTIGDFISAVMRIDSEHTAREFAAGYVEWLREQPDLKEMPEAVMRANIGWCFGEGMTPERIAMWRNACDAFHPFFGSMVPGPEEALRLGQDLGSRQR